MGDLIMRRRVLKKVRINFINRRPDEAHADAGFPPQQLQDNNAIQMIDPAIGLVERNRKICVGVRFLNSYITINNLRVEEQISCKAVTFNIQMNQDHPILPWEHCVKRLESYGDLNLATWAQKIRSHHSVYPEVMAQYFELTKSQDPNTLANFAKAKNQVMLVQREIQSAYPYKCVRLFSNGSTTVPLEASYSEGFLKEISHTLESFCDLVRDSGIPTLFGGECPYHLEMAKSFLDCSMFQADPVKYGAEFHSYLYDKNGMKRLVCLQSISFVEPAPGGLFLTGYLVIKSLEGGQTLQQELQSQYDLESPKRFKGDFNLANTESRNV